MTELHIAPHDRTATWRLYGADANTPRSEHNSATDAESAARAVADERRAERIIVHDRYHRTHDAAPSPAQLAAREQRERTRRIAIARATLQTARTPTSRPPR